MKKEFVEPKLKRIELNMKENIASSGEVSMGYYFNVSLFSCTIQSTNKLINDGVTDKEAEVCLVSTRSRIGGGMIFPVEEVRPHF